MGMEFLEPILKLFKNDEEYGKNIVVVKLLNSVENHSQGYIASFVTGTVFHMVFCVLAIVGALKLKKWLLLPFIIGEFFRVVISFAMHIILMIILKKKLSLGLLIAVTLVGGFVILYLAYNWTASVALFQIIELIHSERYRKLYGEDPFHPLQSPNYNQQPQGYGVVRNIRVLVTPRSGEIDAQKMRQTERMPVIAVLPANYGRHHNAPLLPNKQIKKKQQRQFKVQPYKIYEAQRNESNAEFGNWQWSEVAVGRQKSTMIQRKW
ncbi:unnamed protein product [Ceratitis capitata]|uniref:(Mediterranean fruit fly) hypothetical protein n=1 Tax=Ceratitis capitata TaxID=7213 RepID=A0A811UKF1_CERCA|nr:unnamed protein product [Ceratitis capitata]